ncbi:hypothetical protein BZG36_01891 [Bifiguratus adelaidae]|uniref:Nucleolar protein 9 n=1 Tax=Bifiguratus adelaidae TaxID=1938954 RepID=A0A261Y4H0_9FUNG|nr:hypothetical protein BZG36_01891 [Bifiguratus adelaidae]
MPRTKRRWKKEKTSKEEVKDEKYGNGTENGGHAELVDSSMPDGAGEALQDYNETSQDMIEYSHQEERPRNYDASQVFYGYLDTDLQSYFTTVESKIDASDWDSVEERNLFITNVLSEVEGKELILATDHKGSMVLEKLLPFVNDFALRVFFDRFNGQFSQLLRHRFASHVCQTVFSLAIPVLDKETKGQIAQKPTAGEDNAGEGDEGELLTMTELFVSMCNELQPQIATLLSDTFATHPIRILILILAGREVESNEGKSIRSKKSSKYRAKGELSTVPVQVKQLYAPPAAFKQILDSFIRQLADGMSETEVRTLSVHASANPVLQLLLEIADVAGGEQVKLDFLDRILWDLATADPNTVDADRDAWFDTLLRHNVGSHLLETILHVAPNPLYTTMYQKYFRNKLLKLCAHPTANFVVQKLVANVRTPQQCELIIEELGPGVGDFIKYKKAGVIRSMVDACLKVKHSEADVMKYLMAGFGVSTNEQRQQLFHCLSRMQSFAEWDQLSAEEKLDMRKLHLQGALVIEAILSLPADHNTPLVSSFLAQRDEMTAPFYYHPIGSRIIESFILSPNVTYKAKKRLFKDLSGQYHTLAMDKFGSRIVEKCYRAADIDTKQRIAAELVLNERELTSHVFGSHVMRNCHIQLFKQKRAEWEEKERGVERRKAMFAEILEDVVPGQTQDQQASAAALGLQPKASEEVSKKPMDDIDKLFSKKRKHAQTIEPVAPVDVKAPVSAETPEDLVGVLDAIDSTKRKKKKAKKEGKTRKFEA